MSRSLTFSGSMAVCVISAVVLTGAGGSMAEVPEMHGDAARGRELFASKGCVICHAINEVGGTGAPPLDAEAVPSEVDALDFVARMWRGAEVMMFMQQQELGVQTDFTGQELADIIAFVHDPQERRKFSEEDFPALLRHGCAISSAAPSQHRRPARGPRRAAACLE